MTEQVATIMQTTFPTLRPGMPIREAVSLFVQTAAPAAPVVDDAGGLVGIMTQKDCFRSALHASYYQQWSGTVAEHMTTAVNTLDAEMDVVAAAETFLADPYRSYPVVQNDQLVGMLTRTDLLRAFLQFG